MTAKEKYQKQYLIGMEHFLREVRVLSMLSEMSGAVSVYDYFEGNGTAYIVMEYLHGKTLSEYIKEKPLFEKEVFSMFRKLIDALAVLHRHGDKYEGEFKDNQKNGTGTYYYADGKSTTGVWENDVYQEDAS